MNIFYLEYSVLFIILLAAACKTLKVFIARGRKGEPPEKERSWRGRECRRDSLRALNDKRTVSRSKER